MTSVFTLEDFQNLVRNDFKDKKIKPLMNLLKTILFYVAILYLRYNIFKLFCMQFEMMMRELPQSLISKELWMFSEEFQY